LESSRLLARVSRVRPAPGGAAREVDHHALGAGRRHRSRRLGGGVADHQHLGVRQQRLDTLAQQGRDVWDLLLDVAAVRSSQAGHGDAGIEDAHVASLPDERFDERDHGALSEVVGAGLEGEAHDPYPPLPRCQHRLHGAANLPFVRGADRGEQRDGDVSGAGGVHQGAEVLRQARAAEGEAGTEIRLRDVQFPVHQKDPHAVLRVGTAGGTVQQYPSVAYRTSSRVEIGSRHRRATTTYLLSGPRPGSMSGDATSSIMATSSSSTSTPITSYPASAWQASITDPT